VDDLFIADAITAARLACMNINDRSFLTTTWQLVLDYLPFSAAGGLIGTAVFGLQQAARPPDDGSILLPMPPLIAVSSITYTDFAGVVRSLDVTPVTGQVIVSPGTPGRIAPNYGTFFPFSRPTIAAVNITYTAGYGPLPADVPATVRMAMRLLLSLYYERRTVDAPVPAAVTHLLDATRWGRYA
jgi:uncharacterized phiE125 gp8 family phage protein